jgi:hypothetical protein
MRLMPETSKRLLAPKQDRRAVDMAHLLFHQFTLTRPVAKGFAEATRSRGKRR